MLRGDPGAREALLHAAQRADRLVLLGDVVELRHEPTAAVLRQARPILAALGRALGERREVLIVPGNHDHHLLDAWLDRRRGGDEPPSPLSSESLVDWRPGEPLGELVAALEPARVRVRYPGAWLREDVFATHGHLLDRHTTVPVLERLAAGGMARVVAERPEGPRSVEDYEEVLAPVYAWIHALAQTGGPKLGRSSHGGGSAGGSGSSSHGASTGAWQALSKDRRRQQEATGGGAPRGGRASSMRRRALMAGFPVLIAVLNRAGIGPLRRQLSGEELRRASLRALAEVVERLEVDAPHVVFGHTHRAGPLPRDEAGEWRGRRGQQLTNTGCWVHEPAFLGRRPELSPYRAGFAIWLGDEGPPALVNLLDGARGPGGPVPA